MSCVRGGYLRVYSRNNLWVHRSSSNYCNVSVAEDLLQAYSTRHSVQNSTVCLKKVLWDRDIAIIKREGSGELCVQAVSYWNAISWCFKSKSQATYLASGERNQQVVAWTNAKVNFLFWFSTLYHGDMRLCTTFSLFFRLKAGHAGTGRYYHSKNRNVVMTKVYCFSWMLYTKILVWVSIPSKLYWSPGSYTVHALGKTRNFQEHLHTFLCTCIHTFTLQKLLSNFWMVTPVSVCFFYW